MIGRMRHRIVIEAASGADDGAGGRSAAWAAVATAWAAIEALQGRESETGDAAVAEGRFRIAMRWRGDVSAANRLREGGRSFEIASVADPDGRGRYLICLCTERSVP